MTDQRIVRIKRCSNPVLWYNDYIEEYFEVVYETDAAVWVRIKNNQNAWIYKSDLY